MRFNPFVPHGPEPFAPTPRSGGPVPSAIELYADDGRAIRQKGSDGPIVTSVALSSSDSPENWEDCDLPDGSSIPAVSAE